MIAVLLSVVAFCVAYTYKGRYLPENVHRSVPITCSKEISTNPGTQGGCGGETPIFHMTPIFIGGTIP